jgi:hypothetical protein
VSGERVSFAMSGASVDTWFASSRGSVIDVVASSGIPHGLHYVENSRLDVIWIEQIEKNVPIFES